MFAHISCAKGGKLVSASSPAASVVEVQEMSMDGDTVTVALVVDGLERKKEALKVQAPVKALGIGAKDDKGMSGYKH